MLDVLVVVIANRLLQVVKAFLGRTVISDRAVKRFYSLHRGKFKQCSETLKTHVIFRSTLNINIEIYLISFTNLLFHIYTHRKLIK